MKKVLEEKDFRKMPWKNGKGSTQEIMVWPPGTDDFSWRVSRATLSESGPFSRYPGIHRWIALLDGGPVILKHPDRSRALEPLAPYQFDGNEETYAEVSAPGSDFNLMLKSGKATGQISSGKPGKFRITARFTGFFFPAENRFTIFEDEIGKEVDVPGSSEFLIVEINV